MYIVLYQCRLRLSLSLYNFFKSKSPYDRRLIKIYVCVCMKLHIVAFEEWAIFPKTMVKAII